MNIYGGNWRDLKVATSGNAKSIVSINLSNK